MKINDSLIYVVEEPTSQKEFMRDKLSSRFIKSSIKGNHIYKNDVLSIRDTNLKKGDVIRVDFPDENPNGEVQHTKLDIVYEDRDILVINKPPNMVTHTSRGDMSNTLLNYTLGYFEEIGLKRKVRFVNRLDRDTSGLVIAAKNSFAHAMISEQFQKGVIKEYLALVKGTPKDMMIEAPIARTEEGILREVREDGKYCKTSVRLLKSFGDYSLVRLRLYTGRTHQIRVHMKYIGYPLLGDTLYSEDTTLPRQALHSFKVSFKSPRDGRVEITAKLPEDMKQLLIR
ncbi:23S rRNA pseudouridine1911/1915/1917 synthase [Peptoniphilus asaccharolyticus DSM 20463]|uniref:Pseudouridine synthase n=1 Tax=Peptoniphilus asaccharolyticus DSM 20463 TaxID=573058 RepID=A0A1W1VMA0_PEPAS|nr:RluA family pseudouridine synthase [Peptoniphilus asaccharolyticus]MBL7574544.1 RluA family pseudouridine synthase [Peptoniphilus asaccharolyticus]SMB94413.1 23S rRNA pseudouridine1911/1915/1917 synthase [Peptoniphilus asaccharolyticus DSM 20463]